MRYLDPETRLSNAVSFVARSAGSTPADVAEIAKTLADLTLDRPRLLEVDWATLLDVLVTEADELGGLWDSGTKEDLQRRVQAAERRRDGPASKKSMPKWPGGGPQNYVPQPQDEDAA
jgi:hypothetical protein